MALEKLGPYKIEKLLGRGGMGAVYVGVDESTGQRAAVKVLATHLNEQSDFRSRFMGEVEAHKKLRHPNIVQVLGFGVEGEHLYYAMELIDGNSLQDLLQQGRRFTWRETVKIAVGVCNALKLAHVHGVIHRDLKPANLMLDTTGTVKLTDFGIAKDWNATSVTAAGGVLGTADFMAPEQAEGKQVTPRSDLYSLGSVMYALLTGRPPFAAKTLAEVLHGLRFEKPIPVRRLAPDTPPELDELILQLLEKDPSKRIVNATTLGNFLGAMDMALSEERERAKPGTKPLPGGKHRPPPRPSAADATMVHQPLDKTSAPPANVTSVGPASSKAEIQVAHGARLETISSQSGQGDGPGEGSKSVFVTVAEEERRRSDQRRREEEGPPMWIVGPSLVALLVLAGGGIWWATRPATADAMYRQIQQAADSGDPSALVGVEDRIAEFKERHPNDVRIAEMSTWVEQIELIKLQRHFKMQALLSKRSEGLRSVERLCLEAYRGVDQDPDGALARFRAIVALFGETEANAPDDAERKAVRKCVDLARSQVAKLEPLVAALAERERPMIEQQLGRAERLSIGEPKAAAEIRRGVIALYGEKSWAVDLVAQARDALGSDAGELPEKRAPATSERESTSDGS